MKHLRYEFITPTSVVETNMMRKFSVRYSPETNEEYAEFIVYVLDEHYTFIFEIDPRSYSVLWSSYYGDLDADSLTFYYRAMLERERANKRFGRATLIQSAERYLQAQLFGIDRDLLSATTN